MSGDVSIVSEIEVKVMSMKGQRGIYLPGSYSERASPALKLSGPMPICLSLHENIDIMAWDSSTTSKPPLLALSLTCLLNLPFPVAKPAFPLSQEPKLPGCLVFLLSQIIKLSS